MTNEQINIAIAAATNQWRVYVYDLNDIYQAEEQLTPSQREQYCDWLCDLLACPNDAGWNVIRATARQRAEAFLRTIGKWEEEEEQNA